MFSFIKKAHQLLFKKERWGVWLIIIGVLVLSSVPLGVAWLTTPAHKVFTGVLGIDSGDIMVYLSQIQEASRGHLLLHNLYTSENPSGLIFSPLWLVLGWIKAATGLSALFIFHMARIIFGAGFLYFLYLFISKFFQNTTWRLICFLMICLDTGLGLGRFIVDMLVIPNFTSDHINLWLSQSHIFTTIQHSPLFIVSLALLLLIFWWTIERLALASLKENLIISGIILLMGLIHPYNLMIVGVVLLSYVIIESLKKNKPTKVAWRNLIIMGLGAALAAVYFWWLFKSDAAVAVWAKQNITLSPDVIFYLWEFGIVLLLFLVGAWLAIKNHQQTIYFLLVWGLVGLGLLYAPIQFQRRLVNGLIIPITIVGIIGLRFIWEKLHKAWLQIIMVTVLILLLLPSTIFNIGFNMLLTNQVVYQTSNGNEPYAYLPADIYNGLNWITNNLTSDSVILSSVSTGLFVPYFGGTKVYLGHHHQTGYFVNKRQQVEGHFFADNDNDQVKWAWLKNQNIDYVFWGPAEQTLGNFIPRQKGYLQQIYSSERVEIYKVR